MAPFSDWSSQGSSDEVDDVDEAKGGCPVVSVHPSAYNTGAPADLTGGDTLRADESSRVSEVGSNTMSARAYQLEMLEQSLKRNIIVAMDTGSGKTQVAVLRIIAELERTPPGKRVWFLAPTVALCSQQYEVLRSQIQAVQAKFLSSADDVDHWSEQRVWDSVLQNVRVVVSTYQILLDVLNHGFVQLDSIALIVFDEAHNCVKKNPGGRIMELYWEAKSQGRSVPHILGLTASPLMRSNIRDLDTLEKTLDAVCRCPNIHRDELITHVNRPQMFIIYYGSLANPAPSDGYTSAMLSLRDVYLGMDIMQDPYILQLRSQNTERSRHRLQKALERHEAPAQTLVKAILARSVEMCRQLGQWAADYYIFEVIKRVANHQSNPGSAGERWADVEKRYLLHILRRVRVQQPAAQPTPVSSKFQSLVSILLQYDGDPTGIIFVKERATVPLLSRMIASHPLLQDRYRVAGMVGTSQVKGKADLLDLAREVDYSSSLQQFRSGRRNLLIATSVLEEGIDVPACNMVICLDRPPNLKSFIQRRGRARASSSQLYLLLDDQSEASAREWESLEDEMKRRYQDEIRELQLLERIEESEDGNIPPLVVASTGARLTIGDAKSHLERFCATLSSRKFVEWNPYYIVRDTDDGLSHISAAPLLKATVLLPISLPREFHRIESSRAWRSEKNACNDAAFQAYTALYRAGLVNENLVPMTESDLIGEVEQRAGKVIVREQFDPWPQIAQAWKDRNEHDQFRRGLRFFNQDGSVEAHFSINLPIPIPDLDGLVLYWAPNEAWSIEMAPPTDVSPLSNFATSSQENAAVDHTHILLSMAYGHRWQVHKKDQVVRLRSLGPALYLHHISCHAFDPQLIQNRTLSPLIRDVSDSNHPYIYEGWLSRKPPAELVRHIPRGFEDFPDDVPYVVVRNWPKKAGFFQRPPLPPTDARSQKLYPGVILATSCKMDSVPAVYARFGMLIPAILHALEVRLVATELLASLLSQTGISNLSLIMTAISAPSACEDSDYNRLEFLGDSILKLCTTINCAASFPLWPEGYLSRLKDNLVANWRLSKAAVVRGLDQFIITKGLTLTKWRPKYVEDLLTIPDPQSQVRELSTKTLADVVEALIGASYVSGGIPKALMCISLFLPEIKWQDIEVGRQAVFQRASDTECLPMTMARVEELIGYTFTRKSLLIDALTHSSYVAPGTTGCLERLEFFGDAILEYIVVDYLFALKPPLSHYDMHLLRAALVNGEFLGFLVMEWNVTQQNVNVVFGSDDQTTTETGNPRAFETTDVPLPLWAFMRHSNSDISAIQRVTSARHAALRRGIVDALGTGTSYPWAQLARLRPQKFYSDVFESVLGAVWVDSGSLAACKAVTERGGVLPRLRRLVADRVHVLHPKEELGMLANTEKVAYDVSEQVAGEAEWGGPGGKEFACRVFVGDRCVAEVKGGLSREEVRTRAAEEAVRLLKAGQDNPVRL